MMRKPSILLVLVLVCFAFAAAAEERVAIAADASIGARVPAFEAETLVLSDDGVKTAQFDSHATDKVTAYVFVGTKCPTTVRYIERFRKLEEAYEPKGVDFIYVYPSRSETSEAEVEYHRKYALGGRLIHDPGGKVTRLLGAKRTSEILLTSEKGTILYRGAADDYPDESRVKNRWLAQALDEHLAGKPVTKTETRVFACGLRY